MNIYERLGIRTVINGNATLTRLGGSIMPPEVVAATSEPQKSEKAVGKASDQKSEKDSGASGDANGVAPNVSWEVAVDAAWAKRDVEKIAGRSAASDAAKILGTTRLSDSEYPTLAKLLGASTLLQLNWRREGNAIFRK